MENVVHASCSNADNEQQIPRITISPLNSAVSSATHSQLASHESLALESVAHVSCSIVNDEKQIPRIGTHPTSSASYASEFGQTSTEHNEPEPVVEADQSVKKKGTIHALRKYIQVIV